MRQNLFLPCCLILLFFLSFSALSTLQDDPFAKKAPASNVETVTLKAPTSDDHDILDEKIPDKVDMANFLLVFSMTFVSQLISVFFGGFYIAISLYQKYVFPSP